MKLRMITFIIIFLTTLFTVKVFLGFQKRWKATERFQKSIINAPIFLKHLLIPPKQLGVDTWHPGDYAAYQFKTNEESDLKCIRLFGPLFRKFKIRFAVEIP